MKTNVPAVQLPEHPAVDWPALLPYRPTGHGALQAAVASPAVNPYSPATQSVHVPDPITLYFPAAHIDAVPLVDSATHAYPAVHCPVHEAVDCPEVLPYVPAGHGAVQAAVVSPGVDPYNPAIHGVHDPAPAKLY